MGEKSRRITVTSYRAFCISLLRKTTHKKGVLNKIMLLFIKAMKHETKAWSTHNVPVMQWSAASLYLNPIENLWGVLSRRVHAEGRQFESVASWKQKDVTEWGKVGDHLCHNLVASMPKCCIDGL